ncbi:MOSC domain-containing protein [Nocardioides zeae]|uniref:MOSC domain-containing protein n=1 Tax=Nocardioides zeae TaxID=1457234 RepID=UPI0030846059
MPLAVSALHRYPVKSMHAEDLDVSVVEPWGLAGDRRWMVVEATEGRGGRQPGDFVSARTDPALLLVRARLLAEGYGALELATGTGAASSSITVPVPDPATQLPVEVWGSHLTAAPQPAADAWLSDLLGRPLRLVHLDDPTRRPADPRYSHPDDRVSFADGYPLLLTTTASLAALDDALLEHTQGAAEPLGMARFRPNLVLAGDEPAWAEDDWRRIRVGDVTFRAVKGCARCVMTTFDPTTGERGHEPTRTLARLRRYDGGVWFGINLVPDVPAPVPGAPAPEIRVGDDVEVLERAPAGDGPLRTPA